MKFDFNSLILGMLLGGLATLSGSLFADERIHDVIEPNAEQFEPVDIPENMYFIFGMYMSGEAQPAPQIFGPGTVEECKAMQQWWHVYATKLQEANKDREVYLTADCMAEDKLKMKSI